MCKPYASIHLIFCLLSTVPCLLIAMEVREFDIASIRLLRAVERGDYTSARFWAQHGAHFQIKDDRGRSLRQIADDFIADSRTVGRLYDVFREFDTPQFFESLSGYVEALGSYCGPLYLRLTMTRQSWCEQLVQLVKERCFASFKKLLTHPSAYLEGIRGDDNGRDPVWLTIRLFAPSMEWIEAIKAYEQEAMRDVRDSYAEIIFAIWALDSMQLREALEKWHRAHRAGGFKRDVICLKWHGTSTPLSRLIHDVYHSIGRIPDDKTFVKQRRTLVRKSLEIADLLLAMGNFDNIINCDHLKSACALRQLELFELLLNRRAVLAPFLTHQDPFEEWDHELLHTLIGNGNGDAIIILMKHISCDISKGWGNGNTDPIRQSLYRRGDDAAAYVCFFANQGADVNYRAEKGTPLEYVLEEERFLKGPREREAIFALLSCGAVCSKKPLETRLVTALRAYKLSSVDVVDWDLFTFFFLWALTTREKAKACFRDPQRIIALIKNRNQDPQNRLVDRCDVAGLTPLMWAAARGQMDLAKVLVERLHANVDGLDRVGDTALHYAVRADQRAMVEYLLSHRAGNKANTAGITPLKRARLCNRQDVVKIFMDRRIMALLCLRHLHRFMKDFKGFPLEIVRLILKEYCK